MASSRAARLLRSDRNENPVQKLRRGLQDDDLAVLESLPPPDSHKFRLLRSSGHATVELCLGDRPRVDGARCESWARIVTAERRDLQPPVVFYDKWRRASKDGTRNSQSSRSATSLLRRAAALRPPFCFLQHDPVDEERGARNKLCAIILYQALVTGADTCALHWEQFEDSLSQALQYIKSLHAYREWVSAVSHPQVNGAPGAADESEHPDNVQIDKLAAEKPRTATTGSDKGFSGGVVQPGGVIFVRPNTSLAKLKEELGDRKFASLDQMPAFSLKLEPHSLGPPYFPFRMLVGRHTWQSGEPFKVYACLEHDRTKTPILRFLSHDRTGYEQTFTMDQLQGITLLQPLEYLNNFKKTTYSDGGGSSARAAKIRSVILYYFFLAENEGMIGNPRVKVGEAFGKRLCAANKELQGADFGVEANGASNSAADNSGDDETHVEVDVSIPPPPTIGQTSTRTELAREEENNCQPSRIVRLAFHPEILKDMTKGRPPDGGDQNIDRKVASGRACANRGKESPEYVTIEQSTTVQVEGRKSSQNIHKSSELLRAAHIDQDNVLLAVMNEANEVACDNDERAVEQLQIQASGTRRVSMVARDRELASDMVAVDATRGIRQESSGTRVRDIIPTISLAEEVLVESETTAELRPIHRLVQNPQAAGAQNLDDRYQVLMNPSPTKSSFLALNAPTMESKANSEPYNPFIDIQNADICVPRILNNKPSTPHGSAERKSKPQAILSHGADLNRPGPVVIDLCSDGEDVTAPLRILRSVVGQNEEVKNKLIVLTQASPRSQDKKRKFNTLAVLAHSDDEAIEETDGSAHRRARLHRRK